MPDKSLLILQLAQWVSSLRRDDIPERVLKKARLQILSVLAAVHSSSHTDTGKKLLAAVQAWDTGGPCSLIPSGKKASLLNAVFANTALSVAQDYDDYLLFGHTGHSAVLVALLLGEREGTSIQDCITAQVAANEIEGRIGASVLLGPHNGQAWSFIHLIGGAAASSKLLGLDTEATAHAMAVSMYQPTYVLMPGFMGPDSKLLTPATPSMAGVQAALLAEKGFTGALDLLENQHGFFQHFSYYPLAFMVSGLGQAWVTDTLAYKIYPGCAYIDTTVDAVLKIREDYKKQTGRELEPNQVEEVLVEATTLTTEMDHLSKVGEAFDVLNPVSINFSIPANVAICLLKGRLFGEDLEPDNLKARGKEIKRLADRVVLKHDLNLTARMVGKMNETLDLARLLREVNIVALTSASRRIQKQYQRRMGLGAGELIGFLRESGPEMRSRVWQGIKREVGKRLTSEDKRAEGSGYDLGNLSLENFTMPFSARVTITLKDDMKFTHQQDVPLGGPGHPFEDTSALVKEKYARETGRTLSSEKVKGLLERADALEEFGSARDLLCATCLS
jgi:2-methylcitrate dehydratase PrpD